MLPQKQRVCACFAQTNIDIGIMVCTCDSMCTYLWPLLSSCLTGLLPDEYVLCLLSSPCLWHVLVMDMTGAVRLGQAWCRSGVSIDKSMPAAILLAGCSCPRFILFSLPAVASPPCWCSGLCWCCWWSGLLLWDLLLEGRLDFVFPLLCVVLWPSVLVVAVVCGRFVVVFNCLISNC